VNREFYSERDVVYEERRLRTESTPTGKFDEQFESMFWQSHPYGWPVVGWPSDLRVISKQQADDYYATYYAPNNLTAALVGNLDVKEAKALARKYFGRLKRAPRNAPAVVTTEMEQLAEKRMVAECDCQPQTSVRYHTVPFMHKDSYALDVLGGLLSGRTGRLYKSLVLDKQIATSAFGGQNSMKWAGHFSLFAEAKGETTPAELETALYAELDRLAKEPIPAEELQKVKNQIAANAFRRLEGSFFLMLQLLLYDGLGDYTYLNTWSVRTLAVTEADVKAVIGKYFSKENRAVAHYLRKAGASAEEELPGLAELEPQQQQMIKNQIRQLKQVEDPAQLDGILAQVSQQKSAAPPEFKKAIGVMESWIKNRIEELNAAGGDAAEGGE
ncbi:MAG: insulinase family protein, partial [Acidobacteriota bacterium]|nr:insulinase family protein [Acidobacteriota bacterium]